MPAGRPRGRHRPLTLEQIIGELAEADAAGHDVARLHSGDPSLYSAVAEQCRRLDQLGIGYEIVPGCRPSLPRPRRSGGN